MRLLPADEDVVDSPLTVHEATVRLRGVLPEEFGSLARIRETKAGDAVEFRALRDWSDSRRAFRLEMTLRPAPGGSQVVISTRASPRNVLAEAVLAGCGTGIVLYKTGLSVWSLLAVGVCVTWLPVECSAVYKSERDRLRPVLLRAVGL